MSEETTELQNGTTEIIKEMGERLEKKEIPPDAVIRLLLKKELHDIKVVNEMRKDIGDLKRTSIGYRSWLHPGPAFTLWTIVLLFLVSESRYKIFYAFAQLIGELKSLIP